MLLLVVLLGLLLSAFGIFIHRRGRKGIGWAFVVAGALLALPAIVAFIVALLNFHP